jgi:hypothetical protein
MPIRIGGLPAVDTIVPVIPGIFIVMVWAMGGAVGATEQIGPKSAGIVRDDLPG